MTAPLIDWPLDGTHRIEASAGTGKTFALALLHTRLVVERELPVRKILAVTYTIAATQELRERLVKLDARAGAVRSSLQNLKNAQAAGGMSLRGDMTAAESRMNHMLDGANSALRAHDAAAAEKFMQSADTELEKLEKFLNL